MTALTGADQRDRNVVSTGRTRLLFAAGILAGPVYVASVAAQMMVRDGFDIRRHPASVLSNGEHGWVQTLTFLVTGVLFILLAIGLRLLPSVASRRPAVWGPRMVGLVGAGMVAASLFPADPVDGFPPGTPEGPPTSITLTGLVHFFAGTVTFLALITACYLYARLFAACESSRQAWGSAVIGTTLLVSWILMFVLPGVGAVSIALSIAIALALLWTSLIAVLPLRASVAGISQGE